MKSGIVMTVLGLICLASSAQQTALTRSDYREDFEYFWSTIREEYCYFNKKATDWNRVHDIYGRAMDTVTNRDQLVSVLEKALYEIYDHHAILNTNTDSSQRLVPSGTDAWAAYVNGIPLVQEVRAGFGSQQAGVKPGMEIVAINDLPVAVAVKHLMPRSLNREDTEAENFALRLALAGNHHTPRKFTLKYDGKTADYFPDRNGLQLENIHYENLLTARVDNQVGYIKINDCLYNNDLVAAFDSCMQTMAGTRALILDLRETPSGGNTTVARAILSWFITHEHFYQKHEYYAEEKSTGIKRIWEEMVSPRKGKYYGKPLVILCDHWTGSIAEGIVIGFDALQRPSTQIMGTELARLNGAVYSFEMPHTHIHFTFPAERLYHINGQPRELYRPPGYINWQKGDLGNGHDIFMEEARKFLNR